MKKKKKKGAGKEEDQEIGMVSRGKTPFQRPGKNDGREQCKKKVRCVLNR